MLDRIFISHAYYKTERYECLHSLWHGWDINTWLAFYLGKIIKQSWKMNERYPGFLPIKSLCIYKTLFHISRTSLYGLGSMFCVSWFFFKIIPIYINYSFTVFQIKNYGRWFHDYRHIYLTHPKIQTTWRDNDILRLDFLYFSTARLL